MISMLWISQSALRFADTELFTTILCGLILMWLVVSIRNDEERGVTGLFQHLITGFLCIFASIWNKKTKCQDEKKAMNPKKEKKKKKEIPPPVIVDDKKRKNKKLKRSQKKSSKENSEPAIAKKMTTKMYPTLETCWKLNRDDQSVYECLKKYTLTKLQLDFNKFPSETYKPPTQVDPGDSTRTCSRCHDKFEVYNGVYLSATKCNHHPLKAKFGTHGEKIYQCCNLPIGAPPCKVTNHHVTQQHGPRQMMKTASKRHVKKDLQQRIYSLDCEMSFTTGGLEVTRIGVVDINGLTVYDSYVKPKTQILDYNTRFSGVEKHHLDNVKITIDDVKTILSSIIHEDTILVGHALNNDLAALGIIHKTVVDTSVIYENSMDPMKKRSLKSLAAQYLGLSIQEDPSGHDCIEDARTSLRLALLKISPDDSPRRLPRAESGGQGLQQPLNEIQNVQNFGGGAACAQQHVGDGYGPHYNGYGEGNFYNPNLMWARREPDSFRYDPFTGCYRNFRY